MKSWIIVLLCALLWHAPRALSKTEADADDWDAAEDAEEAVDIDEHQRPEHQDMAGDMPESMYAAIYASQTSLAESPDMQGLKEFVMYERLKYDNLMIADTGADEPKLWFFKSKAQETSFTIYEAKKNGKLNAEQLEKIPAEQLQSLPDDVAVAQHLEEFPPMPLRGMSDKEIRGVLSDHNVFRKEGEDADESDVEEEEDDEEEVGDDGEKKPKRAKRKKFGSWKKQRSERLKKEAKEEKKRRQSFKPFIRMGHNVGLDLPMPLLLAISIGGIAGLIWLGLTLKRTIDSKKEKEVQRREKASRKASKKLKKRN